MLKWKMHELSAESASRPESAIRIQYRLGNNGEQLR
jgi:hypothetical protein